MYLAGMYVIKNIINNNVYVGISKDIERRWKTHMQELIKGYKNKELANFKKNKPRIRHHQIYLQLEFNNLYEIYKEDIWKEVYHLEIVLPINQEFYNKRAIEKIEDAYILELRKTSKGYFQMTNKELGLKYKLIEKKGIIKIVNICEDNKNEIINDYINKKMSYKEIANKYNTSVDSVMRFLKSNNVKPRNYSSSKLKFDINIYKEDIIDMYINKSLNATQIGEKYGVCCSTINNHLTKWGIKLKEMTELIAGVNIEDYKKDIIDMYINHFISMKKIGEKFNVSKTTIARYFKKWKIPTRTTKDYKGKISYKQ